MQDQLFPAPTPHESRAQALVPRAPAAAPRGHIAAAVQADGQLAALRAALPPALRLGTSSWAYPGWKGLVWAGDHSESTLSRRGLSTLAQHPLLRTVCLDRAFYRPLSASQYAALAAQVPADFRFVVKAPRLVTDALVRDEDGRGMQANPAFLDAALAVQEFVEPALQGLGDRLGALVFQLSPLPGAMLNDLPTVQARLARMLQVLPPLRPRAPDGVLAVEVRDAAFLTRAFADLLRDGGATFCLGVHPKMPPVAEQLPMLRALWPGPLVCRWNLHRRHGAYGYEEAGRLYQPYDRIVDDDPDVRAVLARVIEGTTRTGQLAYVTVSNEAEGCAPRSIRALAEDIVRLRASHGSAGASSCALPSASIA